MVDFTTVQIRSRSSPHQPSTATGADWERSAAAPSLSSTPPEYAPADRHVSGARHRRRGLWTPVAAMLGACILFSSPGCGIARGGFGEGVNPGASREAAMPLGAAPGESSSPRISQEKSEAGRGAGQAHPDRQRGDSVATRILTALVLAEDRGDHRAAVQLRNTLGFHFIRTGNIDSVFKVVRPALRTAQVNGDIPGQAEALRLIGMANYQKAVYGAAQQDLEASLKLFRTAGDSAGVLRTLYTVAAIHAFLERVDSARIYTSRALDLARRYGTEMDVARALNNLGRHEIEIAQQTKDRAWFDSSLTHLRAAYAIRGRDPQSDGARITLSNIGFAHLSRGDFDSAAVYFDSTLVLARRTGRHVVIADALRDIGNLYRAKKHPDSTIAYYRDALAHQRQGHDRFGQTGPLTGIAEALFSKGDRASLTSAVAYYDSAVAVFDSIRRDAGADHNQVDISDVNTRELRLAVPAWLRLGELGGLSPEDAAFASLATAERMRGRGLLNLMGAAPIIPRPNLVAEGRQLVRDATRGGRVLLSYFVLEDTLVIWAARDASTLSVTQVPISRDSLTRLVTSARREMAPTEDLVQCTAAGPANPAQGELRLEALSRILVPAFVSRLTVAGRVVVVPDGVLNLLPFAALPLPGTEGPLGVRHALQHSPSVQVLDHLERQPGRHPATADALRDALVVGNPDMPTIRACGGSGKLMDLGIAGAFSRELADSLGAGFLTGKHATRDSIRRLLPSSPLVHLATHGYSYPSAAMARSSWIAVAPAAGDEGMLTVSDIIEGGQLSAELVVLAACNTGLGDVRQAEGTVGLQRAFLGKGARGVLVSLWPMREEATVKLLREFYREWLHAPDRPTKAEALRRAQVEVRRMYPDTRDWAGFQYVGPN